MKFIREIKIGDLFTAITIGISVFGLIWTWHKDLAQRELEQANRFRTASAVSLAKIERVQSLSMTIFEEIQPLIVEASENLDRDRNVVLTRDFLYRGISQAQQRVRNRIIDERIEDAYVTLYGFSSTARSRIREVSENFNLLLYDLYSEIQADLERGIFSFEGKMSDYQTAYLGNELRSRLNAHRHLFRDMLEFLFKPLESELVAVLEGRSSDLRIFGSAAR